MKKGSFVKRAVKYAVNMILFMLNCILFALKCVLYIVVKIVSNILILLLLCLCLIPITPFLFLVLDEIFGIDIDPLDKLSDFATFDFDFDFYIFCWHDYDGCKCRFCGKTRNEGHVFDGCKCRKCGKEKHDFDGCKCRRCGKEHDLDSSCKCRICRVEFHDWKEYSRCISIEGAEEDGYGGYTDGYKVEVITYRCRRCGEERTESHGIE